MCLHEKHLEVCSNPQSVVHKPGKLLVLPDALSRQFKDIATYEVSSKMCKDLQLTRVRAVFDDALLNSNLQIWEYSLILFASLFPDLHMDLHTRIMTLLKADLATGMWHSKLQHIRRYTMNLNNMNPLFPTQHQIMGYIAYLTN